MDTQWDTVDKDKLPYCHIQGYSPRVLQLEQGRECNHDHAINRGWRDYDQHRTPGLCGCGQPGGQSSSQGQDESNLNDAPQGQSLRPDKRHGPFLPGVICATCKHSRHEATSCNMLAIALFVELHKNQLSNSEKASIEDKWIAHWKDKIGQPTRTPRQVMRAYCKELDILADHLARAVDWGCWPSSTDFSNSDNNSIDYE
jgi:hypothetical protein